MAYGDTLRSASALMSDAATLIEGLLVGQSGVSGTPSAINTTSASYVDYTSGSVTVSNASGAFVIVFGTIAVSNSASGNRVSLAMDIDGTTIDTGHFVTSRGDTTGIDSTISGILPLAPGAGSHTYKLRWKTSAGTAYSALYRLHVVILQNT